MAVDPRTLKVGDRISIEDAVLVIADIFETCIRFDDGTFAAHNSSDPDENQWWNKCQPLPAAGAGHPRFLALLDQLREMHLSKSSDYGTTEDIFSNFRGSASLNVSPWVGAMIRAKDKVRRIESFIKNGNLKNEPLKDSFLDLASYALIAAVLFEEAKDGTK